MRKQIFPIFLISVLWMGNVYSLSVSSEDTNRIAEKIWKNECGGHLEELTHWKKGENFASLGIGHFIWYVEGQKERFKETFPQLLQFFEQQHVLLPEWLRKTTGCPWDSREEFYRDFNSSKMKDLRRFLFETKNLQALFIAQRVENALPSLIEQLSKEERERVERNFNALANDPKGLYALIDYTNFKGEGISSAETYKGQGWGLLQVLQRIPPSSKEIVADFVKAAKEVLKQRVDNSPPERNEKQWLQGWLNRVNTYLTT